MRKSLVVVLLACICLMYACSNGKTQSLEEFYKDADIENIDKITIQDGSTGASKTLTGSEQIDEFIALIKDIEFSPQDNQEKRNGWRYGITMFDGEKTFQFTLGEINDTYYDTSPDIQPIVDKYYKGLDIKEE
ncbi:hypothetical protein [Lysinibacillus sp. 54212]|uniref:hypothetical protein n=1 Tax=Lysinibacillus sp. 54212 TaxID=3119829 RepID=UPI002FCC7426